MTIPDTPAPPTQSNLPRFAAIIVAAGKGTRVGGDTPKQFCNYNGKPMLAHSAEALIKAGCDPLIIVAPPGQSPLARAAIGEAIDAEIKEGAATRQGSVRAGLEALSDRAPDLVLIHDAARPDLPQSVIERLLLALGEYKGAIPVLPVVDSLALARADDTMAGTAKREELRRVQTPQAFRFADIHAAHRAAKGPADAGDDAQVLKAAGAEVALVAGDERLKKITFVQDLSDAANPAPTHPPVKVGLGYDVHRLEAGEELWLCGLKIAHTHGLAGHSDADVALHALTDAVLGAIGAGDIGTHFPPSEPQWKGASSDRFYTHALKLAAETGYRLGNVDLTIICEAPKIGPHRPAMIDRIASLSGLATDAVSIKATTTEGLGFTGRREGIAAKAIVSLYR